jgi:hypothetical protein
MSGGKIAAQAVSLLEFATKKRVAERRAGCIVCQLPPGIRAEIKRARGKKIDVRTILEWLASAGHPIKEIDYKAHGSGMHDQKEEAGT